MPTLITKKSTVAGKVPLATDLSVGELAVNTADGKLYTKHSNNAIVTLTSSGGGSGTVTSVSGTGTVSGISLSGTVTSSGNLTLGGSLDLSSPPAIGATAPSTVKATQVVSTTGSLAEGTYAGTFTDGIVVDYVTNAGRISVGAADGIKFYNNGVGGTLLGEALNNGNWDFNGSVTVGTGTIIGGVANPLISANGDANTYVEVYSHNDNTGTSASADVVVYPNNGQDASGWADLGINSSGYADAVYTCSGPNEGYLLMSAPSGSSTTGNFVFATGSTGTQNAWQWYVGGFTQAKSAYKMQLDATNLYVKQPIKADGIVESTTGGFKFPDATTQTSAFIPSNGLLNMPDAWVKKSVICATTANITLSGLQTIDGVTVVAGDRVLVKNQTLAQDNGIYVASATAWSRSPDANTISYIAGSSVNIDSGTVNGGKVFDTDLKITDTLGTTPINWYSFIDTNGATFGGTVTLRSGTATAGTAPLYLTAGTNLTAAAAGAVEYDTANTLLYFTNNTTNGRALIPSTNYFRLTANGAATATTISPFFGTNSSIPLVANGVYEIDIECFFLKNTAGTLTWTLTNSTTVTNMTAHFQMSPITGVATAGAAPLTGYLVAQTAAAAAFGATGSLTTAVNHFIKFKIILENGSSTSIRLNVTNSAGTITPLRGSFWKATRITNVGTYAA